jgi:TRAP-type C4-dicarboxylate transport system substrate-binding protein
MNTARSIAVSLLAAGSVAAAPAVAQQTMVLRFSQWIPAAHFTHAQGFHKYFDDIAKATEGRVKIEPTAQALGAPPRQMQLAVDGIADVAWGAHGYTPGTFPLSELLELPFVTKNTEANSVAYWRIYKAMFEKTGMHPAGVHVLALHVHPAGHVYNNRKAIRTVDDFKGLKLRTVNNSTTDSFKAFGAIPLPMPSTQARDALSKGIADGTAFTDEAIFNFRIEEFIKHATRIPGGLYNTSFFMVMNKAKWDAIAKKDQDAIMALSGEALARRLGKLWDAEETAAADKLKARGVEYLAADAAMIAKMRELLAPQEKKWVEDAKAKGVDGAAALKMLRDELTKL